MYGNLVTNRQLEALRQQDAIFIRPFEVTSQKESAYTLTPARVLQLSDDGDWDIVHSFSERKPEFVIPSNGYVVVEVAQVVQIKVPGIVGTFVTASNNIEGGLMIVAGQIDSLYGVGGEQLRFGVKNLLPVENKISMKTRLVHMQLTDMRGSTLDPVFKSEDEKTRWHSRTPQMRDINYSAATE